MLPTVSVSVINERDSARLFEREKLSTFGWVMLVVLVLGIAAGLRLWSSPHPPPALNVDEAANGQDALDVLAGHVSIFFPRVNGREPLWIYIQAASVAVFGGNAFALRFPMACLGTLTVAVTYALGKDWFGRWVGLLAGASIGSAFWHLTLTRTGLRTALVPLFVTLCYLALGQALRRPSRRFAALAGVWMACGLYTYLSMRLIAMAVLFCFVGYLITPWLGARQWRRRYLLKGIIMAGVSVVLVAPLGVYFAQHRELLFERVAQVSVFNPNPHIIGRHMGLAESLARTAGGFFVRGDESWKQNIPGRPVFDPLNGFVFLVGAVLTVVRMWRSLKPRGQALFVPELWLLIWPGVLLGGMALAQESPYFPRQSAAIPAVHLVWALGAISIIRWLGARGPVAVRLGIAGVVAVIGFQTVVSARDLFVIWGPAPQTWKEFDGDIYDAVASLNSSAYRDVNPGRLVVQLDAASGVEFPMPQTQRSVWVRQYTSALPLPLDGAGDAWYFYPHLAFDLPFPRLLPALPPVMHGMRPEGGTAWSLYRLSSARLEQLEHPSRVVNTSFADMLTLVGVAEDVSPPRVAAGSSARLLLLWKADVAGRYNFGMFVHVLDQAGRTWAVADEQADLPNGWEHGQELLTGHELALPPDAPPGPYRLVAGAGLRTIDEQPSTYVRSLGPDVALGDITVTAPAAATPTQPSVEVAIDRAFGGLRLVGRGALASSGRAGQTLEAPIVWQKIGDAADVSAAVALTRLDGAIVSSGTLAPPGGATYPPAQWTTGRYLKDYLSVRIPATLAAGTYQLVVRVEPHANIPEAMVPLGQVRVTDRTRLMTVPPTRHPSGAVFGGSIRLIGYDLTESPVSPGKDVELKLVWQAVAPPAGDLTMFVHLLGSDGRIVTQHDSQPLGGDAPTSGWLPGEVVADTERLAIPAAVTGTTLTPEVGWYDAASGARLPLTEGGSGDHFLLEPLSLGHS